MTTDNEQKAFEKWHLAEFGFIPTAEHPQSRAMYWGWQAAKQDGFLIELDHCDFEVNKATFTIPDNFIVAKSYRIILQPPKQGE